MGNTLSAFLPQPHMEVPGHVVRAGLSLVELAADQGQLFHGLLHAQSNTSTEQKQQSHNDAQDGHARERKSHHAPVRKGRQAADVMVSAHFQNVSPIVEVRFGIGKFNPLDYLGLDYLQRRFGKLLGV
jgi:hypothetical protein